MNLYNYLLNNEKHQLKFCDDLIKDIPELLTTIPNYITDSYKYNYCRMITDTFFISSFISFFNF